MKTLTNQIKKAVKWYFNHNNTANVMTTPTGMIPLKFYK